MSDVKVIPDTNVLVAASIMENMDELGVVVKHQFYDQSVQLFSLFHPPQSVEGYAMPQVKTECFRVLSRAVRDVFVPNSFVSKDIKEKFYDDAVGIVSSSDHKMRSLLGRLRKPKLDNKEVEKNLRKVRQMSSELRDEWRQKYQRGKWRKKESKSRSKSILTEPEWKKEQKDEVVDTYKVQVVREARQLERFVRKPNDSDELILAQAVTFKETLDASDTVLIASQIRDFSRLITIMAENQPLLLKKFMKDLALRAIIPGMFSKWPVEYCNVKKIVQLQVLFILASKYFLDS